MKEKTEPLGNQTSTIAESTGTSYDDLSKKLFELGFKPDQHSITKWNLPEWGIKIEFRKLYETKTPTIKDILKEVYSQGRAYGEASMSTHISSYVSGLAEYKRKISNNGGVE